MEGGKAADCLKLDSHTRRCLNVSSMTAVQFRGLSSHYKSRDTAKVSFRYAVGDTGFAAAEGDQIGVFPENATSLEEKLLLASIKEPSSHHLCDGGLYKTSSVKVDFKDIEVGGLKCQFWYICSKTGLVEGKSDTFTVCVDESDYPSMSFGSMDDQTLLKAVHTRNSSYIDASEEGPKSDSSTLDSSFILVSEENSRSISGSEFASEYVMAQLDPKSEEGSDANQENEIKSTSEITSSNDSADIEVSVSSTAPKKEDEEDSNTANLVNGYVICPSLTETATLMETVVSTDENIKESVKLQVDTPPAVIQLPPATITTTEAKPGSEIETESKILLLDVLKTSDAVPTSFHSDTAAASALLTPLLPPQIPADMSSSTVIIEKHVTQREARSLKSSNRELRLKIHKLTEILEEKKDMLASLTDSLLKQEVKLQETERSRTEFEEERKRWESSVAILKEKLLEHARIEEELKHKLQSNKTKLLSIEGNRRMTESLNKKLLIEKSALEEKVKQLTQENKTIFERSSKLLTQLQDSETRREILRSEKQVLQVKIDYLHAELRKIRVGEDEGRRRQEMVSGMERRAPVHSQEKRHAKMARQQQSFGKPNATHGELLNQQHSFSKTNATEYPRYAPNPKLQPPTTRSESSNMKPPPTTNSPPPLSNPPAQLQVRPNQLPILGVRNKPPKTNAAPKQTQPRATNAIPHTTNAKKDPVPVPSRHRDNPVGGNDWNPKEKEGGVVERRRSDEDYHCMPLEDFRHPPAGEKGRGTSTSDPERQQGTTVETRHHQGGVAAGSKDTETLAEGRIEVLESQLKGGGTDEGVASVECPICGKKLHSRENDFAIMLHVEYCIQLSEEQNKQ